jgi:hypothetical protein
MKHRSIINSKKVKELVEKTVKKALKECAFQHAVHGEPYMGASGKQHDPSEDMIAFAKSQPTQLKMTFEFKFGDSMTRICCQPAIDLTK